MNKEEYLAKLRDPRWQKMRLKVLERDKWKCRFCGHQDKTLHVHHLWYGPGREPWDYELNAFLALCEQCHANETVRLQDSAYDLIQSLKVAGACSFDLDTLGECFAPFNIQDSHPWHAIVFGFHEIILAAYHKTEAHEELKKRYYAQRDEVSASDSKLGV